MITTQSSTEHQYFAVFVSGDDIKPFQELVQRGANLWPDAPPSIKELADLVTSGKILQNYTVQDTSK